MTTLDQLIDDLALNELGPSVIEVRSDGSDVERQAALVVFAIGDERALSAAIRVTNASASIEVTGWVNGERACVHVADLFDEVRITPQPLDE